MSEPLRGGGFFLTHTVGLQAKVQGIFYTCSLYSLGPSFSRCTDLVHLALSLTLAGLWTFRTVVRRSLTIITDKMYRVTRKR